MSELCADNRVLTGMKTKIQTQQIRNFRYLIMWCGLLLTGLLLSVAQSVSAAGIETAQLSAEQRAHISELPSILTAEQTITDDIPFDDRVVVVTFFASWCPPCLDEFKALNAIKNKLGTDNITIVALNVFEEFDDNDEVRMAKFLDNTQPEFRVLEGTDESRELFGGINRIPTLLVYDRTGNMAFNFVHKRGAKKQSVDESELLGAIEPLL